MKRILGIGAGGSTKVILDALSENPKKARMVGLVDDDPAKHGKIFEGVPILGAVRDIPKLKIKFDEALVCVGATRDTAARDKLFGQIKKMGLPIASAVSVYSRVSKSAALGTGCIVMPGVIVNAGAVIGDNVFLNTGSIVEHDCRIGRSSFLSPGCVLSGYVRIGQNTFLGSGTVVSGSLTVGSHVTAGAGSVIVRDIPDGVTCFGNPAHKNVFQRVKFDREPLR